MIDFLIKNKIVITIIFYFLWILSSIVKEPEFSESNLVFWVPVVFLFLLWLVILLDMIMSTIQNKTFWILSMFLLVFFAPVVYLFQRKEI